VQLPYAALLPAEAEHARSLVLTGLREALRTGDLQRGARFHCAALRRLIGLKIPLLDEERIELIHMLFALVTADVPLPLPLRTRWCSLLVLVLKRGKHLSLELPWRPLLAALLRHSVPKLRRSEYRSRGAVAAHLGALASVAAQCRRHFAEGTTVDLLAEIEPLLCPHTPHFHVGAALFSLLLPSHGNEAAAWMGRVLELWVRRCPAPCALRPAPCALRPAPCALHPPWHPALGTLLSAPLSPRASLWTPSSLCTPLCPPLCQLLCACTRSAPLHAHSAGGQRRAQLPRVGASLAAPLEAPR
jgi:hypothetical protein